ncbi:MAG TPA: tetratricopeptide repeat protein [Fimbriimonadaceae bacterium]|nr:tetratricopeptide repeat protein [Fimbriimonadaceae bacterium]
MSTVSLEIQMLGPFRALVHGEPMPRLRTRSIEWLLALLALRGGRAVDRSWLAATLWIDSGEGQSLRNLRDALVHLRRALGPEGARIESPSRDQLLLNLEGATVDVLEFDRLAKIGDEASWQAMVDLYRGVFLEGCQEEWVWIERTPRELTFLAALEELADRAAKRGSFDEALVVLRRAEAADPLRDTVQRQLMRTLAGRGDAPAAMLAFRAYRDRLKGELGLDPDPETSAVFESIRRHAPQAAMPAASDAVASPTTTPAPFPENLPHGLTELIGREEVLRGLSEDLAETRVLTLTGAGGVGKSRLGIETARKLRPDFPDGTPFIALAALDDPSLLATFIAAALDFGNDDPATREVTAETLAQRLRGRRLLLVLDNCEHLVEAVADLCQTLLERCPDLRILATSRQRLGLVGEKVRRVPSLSIPAPEAIARTSKEQLLEYDAVKLFVKRARMAVPEFAITTHEEALDVTTICRRLDGIPLAIELAAARTSVLTVSQIAARLDDRLTLLASGTRGGLRRHQTLRALIDWSYDLLDPDERDLFVRLAVFTGGWTLEAAEAIGGAPDVLDRLSSLVDRSLVVVDHRPPETRYQMLETLREYAAERLRESGQEPVVRERHLAHFAAVGSRLAAKWESPELAKVLAQVEADLGNFRTAIAETRNPDPSISTVAVALLASLWRYWEWRGSPAEGLDLLLAGLEVERTDTPTRVQLLLGVAALCQRGDFKRAIEYADRALDLTQPDTRDHAAARLALGRSHASLFHHDVAMAELDAALAASLACGWEWGAAESLNIRGSLAFQYKEASTQDDFERALHLAERAGSAHAIAHALQNLGRIRVDARDFPAAIALLNRASDLWIQLGFRSFCGVVQRDLAEIARREGRREDAIASLEKSIALCREAGAQQDLGLSLYELGSVYYEWGDIAAAERLYREAYALVDGTDFDPQGNFIGNMIGCCLVRRGDYDEALTWHQKSLERYRAAGIEDGMVWTLDRIAVALALNGDIRDSAVLRGAMEAARASSGQTRAPWDQADLDQAERLARESLGDAAFDAALAEGASLALAEAADLASRRTSPTESDGCLLNPHDPDSK